MRTWYREKPTPIASPRLSNLIFPEGRFDKLVLERLADGVVVCRAGLLDGVEEGLGRGIAVQEEGAGIGAVGLLVRLDGGDGQRILGRVLRARGVDAFGIFLGDLDEGVVLHAVIGDEEGLHVFLAHLGDDGGGLGVVAAVDDRLGFRPLDLLHDGGVVDGAGGDPFEEDDGRPSWTPR